MLLNDGYDVWIGHQRATYWSHGHVHLNSTDREYYETGFQNGMFNYSTEFSETGPYSAQGLSNTAIALISGPNCCLGSAPIRFVNGWDGTTSYKNLLQWQQGIVAYLDHVVTLMLSYMRRCVWPVKSVWHQALVINSRKFMRDRTCQKRLPVAFSRISNRNLTDRPHVIGRVVLTHSDFGRRHTDE
ncbi:hypothetical protein KC19_2G189200 [Ceratodon purpureus]|uniref:Uncharacterized protein n=1 Tax=Ceratodon purpureus TaxID=3225 RepID=A0A8T0IXY2_CERPU|nr:hypothetical protein KC19_2G189200 [Ceratodon purpureus]